MTDSETNSQFSVAPDPAAQPSQFNPPSDSLRRIFLGPEGLRPGWGLLLYVVLFRLMITVAQVLLRPMMHRLTHTLWHDFLQNVVVAACIVLPAVIMSRIEKRPFGDYGLPKRGAFGKNFAWGLVWGVAALSLLLVTLRGLHAFYFGSLAVHGARAVKFALFWALFFFLVSVMEEFLLRGYAQFTLARGIGFWPAATVLSILFAGLHLNNPGESALGILSVVAIALFFCFTLLRTGTLWFALGLHASWDWAQSYFYGVPDSGGMSPGHLLNSSFQGPAWLSGGTVGPEGSVLIFAVIALMFVVFHFAFPEQNTSLLSASVMFERPHD